MECRRSGGILQKTGKITVGGVGGYSRQLETDGGRSGGILQETGKMTAGRSGGILQEKSENGVRADSGDTPGNTQNDGGGSAGKMRENGLRAEWGDAPENSGKMEIGETHCGRSGGILEPRQRKVPADRVGGHSRNECP